MNFTECLNDTWNYFFLGDPENLSLFKQEHDLTDDLMSHFTTDNSGDLVLEKGVLIPLCGINNYPYTIYFQINTTKSVFDDQSNDLQFRQAGYILEVINNRIYLITVPYLKEWTKDGRVNSLKTNGLRPEVNLENGFYHVEISGGETQQESGWEPTLEFTLKKTDQPLFDVKDPYFNFSITSKEY